MKALLLLCALSSLAMGQGSYHDEWASLEWGYHPSNPDKLRFTFEYDVWTEGKVLFIFFEDIDHPSEYQVLAFKPRTTLTSWDLWGEGTWGLQEDLDLWEDVSQGGSKNIVTSYSYDEIIFDIPLQSGDSYDIQFVCDHPYNIRCGYLDGESWDVGPLVNWTAIGTFSIPCFSLTPSTWGSIKTSF